MGVYFVVFVSFFFFFKQKTAYEILTCDWSSDVCSSDLAAPPLFILTGSAMNFILPGSPCGSAPAFYTTHFCCGSALPFIMTISRCGSAPAIYTDLFMLRKRPRFLYRPFLVAAAPPAFYTDQFLLRQRHRFLYCPFLLAAAPPLFILPISRCEIGRAHV